PVLRAEAYRLLYRRAGGPSPGLARRHIDAVDGLVMSPGRPRSLDLPGGVLAACAYGELAMRAGPEPPGPSWRLATRPCPGCHEPGAAHLRTGLALALGTRRPGLTMRPVSGRGTRKLQDILVDARVPRAERDRLPLVFAAGKLALVPGLAVAREFAAPPGGGGVHVTVERVPTTAEDPIGAGGGPRCAVLESRNSSQGDLPS
ncbi:MAG: tRNA lysidine(34) synthetase TilS, partial [Candidatus Dormibacterales bacterium]